MSKPGRQSGRVRFAAEGAKSATVGSLGREPGGHVLRDRIFVGLLFLAVSIAMLGLALILIDALLKGRGRLGLDLLTNPPSSKEGGIHAGFAQPIMGTGYLIGFMILMVVPLGVGAAVYLEEFANRDRWWNRAIEINIQNLAAVPAIVYGILGLAFIIRGPLGLGFILFTGSITLALLVLPMVIIASREAIRAVPPSIREGSLALGATQWQTIWSQTLPASLPGILTGIILAVSRAIGEAAPLLLLGAATFATFNPEPFADTGWTALPVQIFSYARRAEAGFREVAASGVILMLAALLLINSFAIWLRNRYEQKW
jgi:phosphate transport system permease protein